VSSRQPAVEPYSSWVVSMPEIVATLCGVRSGSIMLDGPLRRVLIAPYRVET
jgi:hypothetical protein